MIEKVIFSCNGGLGIITDSTIDKSSFIHRQNVILHGYALTPGDRTTLDGLFNDDVVYEGLLLNDEHHVMIFHLGNDSNIFESKEYYSCFYWINENRIANKYKEGTVRDFIWKNDNWK